MPSPAFIVSAVVVIIVIIIVVKSIHIIPQARARIIERLGRYHRTASAGLTMVIPFIDRMGPILDLREQVQPFPPQPVITEDNLVVNIDTVVYYQVTDPRAATYEIEDYIRAVEQLTTTTLRNVVGGLNLEEALTSRDRINGQLRGVLDEATGKWGIRVSRVELKAIEPPMSIQDSMEKQMRAERDRRAAILTAEGTKQSQILTAEGERQAAILSAEGDAKAAVLSARGEAEAIETVFDAVHTSDADPKLLAYQYLQQLPKIAEGSSNKLWMIPTEITRALNGLGGAFGAFGSDGSPAPEAAPNPAPAQPRPPRERRPSLLDDDTDFSDTSEAAKAAAEAAAAASQEVGGTSDVGTAPASFGDETELRPRTGRRAAESPEAPDSGASSQQPPIPGGSWDEQPGD